VKKKVLMRQMHRKLEASGKVVYIDKESMGFDHIKTAKDLVEYVDGRAAPETTPV
jgi:hypothetical protein